MHYRRLPPSYPYISSLPSGNSTSLILMNVIMNTLLNLCRILSLTLVLYGTGRGLALAQTYAGATPTEGKVYRFKASFGAAGSRPIVSDGAQVILNSATDVVDVNDVDGFWIWTAATAGHKLVSGSGDNKAFQYNKGKGTSKVVPVASATLIDATQAGPRVANSTALRTTLTVGERWIVAHKTDNTFDHVNSPTSNHNPWSNDFLLEEVDVKRYTIAAYGLSTEQANTVGVSYENYSSYLNATGLPVGGFFLFPTGTTPEVSKFTTTQVDGQAATIFLNEAEQRIELYYRNRWLDVLTSTLNCPISTRLSGARPWPTPSMHRRGARLRPQPKPR